MPIAGTEWDTVASIHNEEFPLHTRTAESLCQKFQEVVQKTGPTGDPKCPVHVRCAKLILRKKNHCQSCLICQLCWRAKENEAFLPGSGMTVARSCGNVEMTQQRFCSTAEKLYNYNLISQLLKKYTTAISFHNCKILRMNNRIKCTAAKKMHNCKTNAQQQKNCTTAKQIYCNTNSEALTGYSTWETIILLLFSLAFL
jgi:hypothetical protein